MQADLLTWPRDGQRVIRLVRFQGGRRGIGTVWASIGWTNRAIGQRARTAWWAVCLAWTFAIAHAQSHPSGRVEIEIVADESAASRRLAAGLQLKIPRAVIVAPPSMPATRPKSAIRVAIGPQVLRESLDRRGDGVVIAMYTSSAAYQALTSGRRVATGDVSAIYAEPGPVEQLQLITRLYQRRVPVAVLLSPATAFLQPALGRAAAQQGIALSIERIDGVTSLHRALNRIGHAAALLAVPDADLYAVENVRQVLMATYRRGQAVVGFSRAWVEAGVLATTYSEPQDMAAQLSEMIEVYLASGKLPAPQFPKYFRVLVNERVAQSLNLIVDADVTQWKNRPPEAVP